MLILARKENEAIVIGDNIEVTIVNIKGDYVKIGINAPENVKVFRKEIFTDIQDANRESVIRPDAVKNLNHLLKKK
ncbi:MAG: carbon storage regulator CsrA [Spirochaetales bacterium]|nr:carbon storage regulator CsrA [Spirochaetales bacterium]